jgi:hypothetical protein
LKLCRECETAMVRREVYNGALFTLIWDCPNGHLGFTRIKPMATPEEQAAKRAKHEKKAAKSRANYMNRLIRANREQMAAHIASKENQK